MDFSAYQRLTTEIVQWNTSINPSQEELRKRQNFVVKVFETANSFDWGCPFTVEIFGSCKTGLLLPDSDIDITILEKGVPPFSDKRKLIKFFHSRIKRSFAGSVLIANAKVPIIKLQHTGLSADVSHNSIDGLRTSDLIVQYMNTTPEFKPVFLVVKKLLQARNLTDAATGGLGSFGLALMVFHYIWVTSRDLRRNLSLGEILYGFCTHFGGRFEYDRHILSVRNGGMLIPRDNKWTNYSLCIENPIAYDRNVAAATRMLTLIKGSLMDAANIILECQNRNNILERLFSTTKTPFYRGMIAQHEQRIKEIKDIKADKKRKRNSQEFEVVDMISDDDEVQIIHTSTTPTPDTTPNKPGANGQPAKKKSKLSQLFKKKDKKDKKDTNTSKPPNNDDMSSSGGPEEGGFFFEISGVKNANKKKSIMDALNAKLPLTDTTASSTPSNPTTSTSASTTTTASLSQDSTSTTTFSANTDYIAFSTEPPSPPKPSKSDDIANYTISGSKLAKIKGILAKEDKNKQEATQAKKQKQKEKEKGKKKEKKQKERKVVTPKPETPKFYCAPCNKEMDASQKLAHNNQDEHKRAVVALGFFV